MNYDLAKLILPEELFAHFDIVSIEEYPDSFDICLDEKNTPPKRHNHTYTSKGFFPSSTIQDFPLRGKPVFLHVRKRKWTENQTGAVVSNSFNLTQSGTHLSPEFAAFLKECCRG